MKPDTPLTEVSAHLPAPTAALLGECDPTIQEVVLGDVRTFVLALEENRTELDTITYSIVLGALVPILISYSTSAISAHYRLQQAHQLAQQLADTTKPLWS